MRKILLLVLTSPFLFAQHPDLISNNWYISQIEWSGQTITTPAIDYNLQPSYFTVNTNGQYLLHSRYFNTAMADIVFPTTQNSLTVIGLGCTLAQYWGSNSAAVQNFDDKCCSIFGTNHTYQIINSGTTKTLIITNLVTGNKIHYNNYHLNTRETEIKDDFKIYPNPAHLEIQIENIEKNMRIQIFDISGKLMKTLMSTEKTSINVQHFPQGQYILQIESYPAKIFMKE